MISLNLTKRRSQMINFFLFLLQSYQIFDATLCSDINRLITHPTYIVILMEKNIGTQNIQVDGLPNIKAEEIIVTYIQTFEKILKQRKNIQKLESVEKWRQEIKKSPVMLMYFEGAISQIPQKRASLQFAGKQRPGMLHGYQIDQILDLVNVIAQSPPMFILSHFCGVPINALFMDLLNTPSGNMLFSLPQVNLHLKNIFDDYSKLLKSQKSLKYFNSGKDGWLCPEALQKVNYEQVECDTSLPHYGFDSWNSWFTRKFKQGRRPVQGDDNVIVNAAQNCPLTTVQIPFSNLKASDEFWLKANKYSLYDMFDATQMGVKHIVDESFVGGTLYQGFLSQWYYHWLHAPVSGKIIRSYRIPGGYYQQNPSLDCSQQSNLYYSQVYMSCTATRHVFIIEADNPLIGRVALIAIGMVEVSSCISLVKDGDLVQKGVPIGRFQFGGSSHSIIFDRKANLKFNQKIFERTIQDGYEVSIRQRINTQLARLVLPEN